MSKSTVIKLAVAAAVLVAFVRFRNEIAGLVARVPGVNKLAGVA